MSDDTSGDTGEDTARSALRAVAHPVRLRILSLLTGAEMSAAEVARELGLTHANASYHLRVLAGAGEVVVAGEQKIRGGVAKRYRHPWERHPAGDDRPRRSGRTSDPDRDLYVRVLTEELVRRSRQRKAGTQQLLADAEMWVPPAVWSEVTTLVREASALVHGSARPPRTEGTIHVNLTAAVFEMDDPAAPTTPAEAR